MAGQVLGARAIADVAAAYVAACDPMSDIRGSADYRRHVLPALITEAITRANSRQNEAVLA